MWGRFTGGRSGDGPTPTLLTDAFLVVVGAGIALLATGHSFGALVLALAAVGLRLAARYFRARAERSGWLS